MKGCGVRTSLQTKTDVLQHRTLLGQIRVPLKYTEIPPAFPSPSYFIELWITGHQTICGLQVLSPVPAPCTTQKKGGNYQ